MIIYILFFFPPPDTFFRFGSLVFMEALNQARVFWLSVVLALASFSQQETRIFCWDHVISAAVLPCLEREAWEKPLFNILVLAILSEAV